MLSCTSSTPFPAVWLAPTSLLVIGLLVPVPPAVAFGIGLAAALSLSGSV